MNTAQAGTEAPTRYELDQALQRIELGKGDADDANLVRRFVGHLQDVIGYQAEQINHLSGTYIE